MNLTQDDLSRIQQVRSHFPFRKWLAMRIEGDPDLWLLSDKTKLMRAARKAQAAKLQVAIWEVQ